MANNDSRYATSRDAAMQRVRDFLKVLRDCRGGMHGDELTDDFIICSTGAATVLRVGDLRAMLASSSIGGKDGRCPTCLNALTPGAHALLTQIQDDRAILALIEEVEALRRGVGVTHGDGNDPAMLLKRVVGTREDVDRREAIYREAVAHGKGGWWRCYTCAPATADDNL